MAKKMFSALLAALLVLGAVSGAYATQISSDGDRGDANRILTAVFNDSGSTLQSGAVVIWDTDSGDPVDSGLGAYVTTTTTADVINPAGVVVSSSILDQQVGTICVYGPVYANHAFATDGATDTVLTAIGTTTVAGQYGTGTRLGMKMETTANSDSGNLSGDNKRVIIFVNPY